MIIRKIEIEQFRSFLDTSFYLGKRITVIAGRNATQKTTVLGMLGQPFSIPFGHPMYGATTIDGYNFRSQFSEKFKISTEHDTIGEHRWKLDFHPQKHTRDYFKVASIERNQRGHAPTLRFWNAESRARGAGYVQIPVYFLSLSRLFPIGESKRTQTVAPNLTQEDLVYCIAKYRSILSIQPTTGESSIGLEKGASASIFSGVNDDLHDIFTNSAGEGNVTRILLAVLSFKRLMENYNRDYKGGILLIDELDATLHGYSQRKLVEYLSEAAREFRIQIVFTTHSPIVLSEVNKLQRQERQNERIERPLFAYDNAIVYLEPQYDDVGTRTIAARNITGADEMKRVIQDINLSLPVSSSRLRVYCEDAVAVSFVRHILVKALRVNLDRYMEFVDVNLGWSNYVQLYEKNISEFRDNPILLDGDVPQMPNYQRKRAVVEAATNILFIPLAIERDLFALLKDHGTFNQFHNHYSQEPAFTYDQCFSDWSDEIGRYNTEQVKDWFARTMEFLGGRTVLYDFWYDQNRAAADSFVDQFRQVFNVLANKAEVDGLPTLASEQDTAQNQTLMAPAGQNVIQASPLNVGQGAS